MGLSIFETGSSEIRPTPASDLARAIQAGLPYAAGEAARMIIRDWAQSVGLELLQGRDGEKYPDVERRGYWAGYYIPWTGNGPAIAWIPPDAVIPDCDTPGQCQIAHLDLPGHFSTRGTGGCKHYFHHDGGLPRMLRALGRPLDFLANPEDRENWVKVWDVGYEVLTWHPDAAALPASLLELHAAAVAHAEEMRSRLGSVPVEQYLREGIAPGQQSYELWRSACSLAACGHNELEARGLLRQIADRCELTRGPWHDRQLASMARRAVEQFGRPAAPKQTLRSIRERMAEKASDHSPAPEGDVPGGLGEAERLGHEARLAEGAASPFPADAGEGEHEGVSAGQENIGLLRGRREPVRVQKTVCQRKPRQLKTEKQVLTKLRAEADPHPLSMDWDRAPEGTPELYWDLADLAIEAIRSGAPLAQVRTEGRPAFQLNGPWRNQVAWLLTGNGAALIEHRGGLITLLPDPEARPQSRYPGAPPDLIPGNPGRSWKAGMLDYYVLMIRGCPGGEDLTQRKVCEVLNHQWFRTVCGLRDHKYVSVTSMSNSHVRRRKEGTLRITDPAVHYREYHRWRLYTAARYRSGLRPGEGSELDQLLRRLIEEVREPDDDDLRERAEARKHPLQRAMEEAFA